MRSTSAERKSPERRGMRQRACPVFSCLAVFDSFRENARSVFHFVYVSLRACVYVCACILSWMDGWI